MILFQTRIYRRDLRLNHRVMYVYGDNAEHHGFGGQAKEMRGEPNAVGIVTKVAPGRRDEDYFSDDDFEKWSPVIAADIAYIERLLRDKRTVVFPADGIGTGLSEMPQRCPRLFAFMQSSLSALPRY